MENVIPIADLPGFIDDAIAKVYEGVALARRRGILAELPKEVQFDVTVIKTWQAPNLEIIGTETTESRDNGTSKNTQASNSTRTSNDSSTTNRTGSNNGASAGQNANYTYTD
jgi:hypothetical protein